MNPSWSHISPAYHVRDPFSNMGQFGHPAPVASQGYGHSQYDYGHQQVRGFNMNPYFPPQLHRPQQSFMQQPSYNPPSNGGMDFPIGSFSVGNFGSNDDSRSAPHGGASSPNSRTFETGIIEKLLHSYGFIQCCERQARLFFHFSQFEGNIEHLRIGDPVQFEVTFDKRNGKPIASAVSKITPESAVGEERVTGVVTTELKNGEGQGRISYENRGECFFLPYTNEDVEGNVTLRVGDTVSFQMTTSQRTGNLGALYIRLENLAQPVRYKGVVCAIRDGVGYIERADVVREISFKLAEAAELGPIQLGDEVEFNIETRNGEEYACRMTRLPAGTVVFEDVDADVLKGQVVKPLDRSVPVNSQDPLPGRLRFRGRDRSENAVPFGEKDQKGNYTLRHGDWVQFNIATDRRDKLQRATNIELLDESFAFSGERRENGVVASLKEGGGFIRCAEREAPLPFSIDEWITPDQELTVGDEVEFTVLQEPTAASKLSAIRMKGLPPGTAQFEVVIQTDLNGTVTREPAAIRPGSKLHDRTPEESGLVSAHRNGAIEHFPLVLRESDFRNVPKLGDEVIFDLAQVKRNKELIAVNLRVVPKTRVPTPPAEKPKVEMKAQKPKIAEKLFENGVKMQNGLKEKDDRQVFQGWVAAIKDAYGFIETLEHDREIFFHFSNYEGSLSNLDIGQEVQYTVTSKGQPQGKLSAENVRPLAKGSIARPPTGSHVYYGTVLRPVRGNNPEQPQYSGLVKVGELEGDGVEYEFGITSLANKKDFLQRGDLVQFQLEGEEGVIMRANNIKAMRTKLRSTVDHMKGQYGFLNYEVDDGKKLFFHMSEVKDDVTLQPGDAVEFYLITNQKTGKSSASNVVKMDSQRPERLIQRLRAVSVDETNNGPRIHVTRHPRGPDGTKGFKSSI